jgi:hypothetical protein
VEWLAKVLILGVPESFTEVILEKIVCAKFRSGSDTYLAFKKLLFT